MPTINITVSAGGDDIQAGSGAGFQTAGGNVILGGYYGTANGWWKFPNVTIPQGATITNATFTGLYAAGAAGTANVTIFANDVDNASNPTSDSDYNAKAVTSASVNHNGLTASSGAYTSPSIVSVIQEIIDRAGWASGNALAILIKDNNSNATYGGFENRIRISSIESGSGSYGTLNVTYSSPITAAIPVGAVALTGVATTVRKRSAVAVGAVALTGVATTVRKRSAVAVGQVAIAGVPTTVAPPAAPLPSGQMTIAGVATTVHKRAGVTAGQVAIAGVALETDKSAGLAIGQVAIAGVALETDKSAGLAIGQVAIAGVALETSKSIDVAVGQVTIAGVALETSKSIDVAVGHVTNAGVALETSKSIDVAVGQVTIAGVDFLDAVVADVAIGTLTLAGVAPTAFRYFVSTASFAACLTMRPTLAGRVALSPTLAATLTFAPTFSGALELSYMTCDGELRFGDLLINNTTDVKIIGLKAAGVFVNDATAVFSLTKAGVAVDGATGLSMAYSGTPGEYAGLLPHTIDLEEEETYRLTATATKAGVAVGQWTADLVAKLRPASFSS